MWGILWRSENKRDGKNEHLIFRDCIPTIFRSRRQARQQIETEWGYLRTRTDLRAEPHGWKMPIPVKVRIEIVRELSPEPKSDSEP